MTHDIDPDEPRLRWVLLTAIVAIGIFMYMNADWVSESAVAKLDGATQAEVEDILGIPTHKHESETIERWCYRRPLRFAEFQVHFVDGTAEHCSYDR